MKIVAGGIPLDEDFYSGRQACVDAIKKRISENTNLLILGPRRTGKTSSIQEYLRQNANAENFRSVFIDLENTQNLYDFYIRLIKEVFNATRRYPALVDNVVEKMKSTGKNLARVLKLEMDLAPFLGSPTEIKLSAQWPEFKTETVELLQGEFHSLLKSLKSPLLIVLDEFPELIWRFGQNLDGENRKQEMIQKTQFLLSGLRMIRQEDFGLEKFHQIIIAGSINLDNTLRHLDLVGSINDLDRLEIPYLDNDQTVDLLHQLVRTEKITFQNEKEFYLFVKNQFGLCSPFYIQSFANNLRQKLLDKMGVSNFSTEEIINCYKNLLTEARGPEYFVSRIERFYSKEKASVYQALNFLAANQFKTCHPVAESKLREHLNGMSQREFTDLVIKMKADDMIQSLGAGDQLGFQSQFLCNFWNYRLVDGAFLI